MGAGCSTALGAAPPAALSDTDLAPPLPADRLTVSMGASTDIGCASKKENQDVYLSHHGFMDEPSRHLYGVMDGHGTEGRRASVYCKQTLPAVMESIYDHPQDEEGMRKAMRRSFEETHARVCNKHKSRCDAGRSGTTATVALIEHTSLLVGWVGDSQACLFQESAAGRLTCSWLSRVHQFCQEDEKHRVLQAGGWVDQSRSNGFPAGPLRVYFKGEGYPGLMVSRSLGDEVAHRIGVSQEPECYFKTLCEEDRYLVMCSDGVWDVMNEEAILEIVSQCGHDMTAAANKIVTKAKDEWAKPWHNGRIDNITAVCIRFAFPQ